MILRTSLAVTLSLAGLGLLSGSLRSPVEAQEVAAVPVQAEADEAQVDSANSDASALALERAHAAVTALLAAHWGVQPEEVVLEWGEAAQRAIPTGFQLVELLGTGGKGHWVVAFDDPSRGGQRVQVVLRAGVWTPVPVASRALSRGESLEIGDIRYLSRVRWGAPGSREPSAEVGWLVQRPVQADEVLERPAVAPPKVVLSGKPVRIVWERGALSVTVMGKAAGSAELGESVYVRTDTGQRLRGTASGPGLVKILETSLEEIR